MNCDVTNKDVEKVCLEQLKISAKAYFDGHAFHYLEVEKEKVIKDVYQGLEYQLSTWALAENLSSEKTHINIFKPMEFNIDFVSSAPRSWWQMLKRDYFPKWFVRKFPVKYKDDRHSRKVRTQVRIDGDISCNVKSAYPKLPEIYPRCGDNVIVAERPMVSLDLKNIKIEKKDGRSEVEYDASGFKNNILINFVR